MASYGEENPALQVEGASDGFLNRVEELRTLSVGGCARRTKRSREELPHVRGQGQKLGGPQTQRAAAKRSYATPKARGGGREEQPHIQGGVAAWAQEGLEELSHVEGQKVRR